MSKNVSNGFLSFIVILPLVASINFLSIIRAVASRLIASPLDKVSKYSLINFCLIFWPVTPALATSSGRFERLVGIDVPKIVFIFSELPKTFVAFCPPLPFTFA